MDSPFASKAFADQNRVTFPSLSDIGGKIIREYGTYNEYGKFNTKIPGTRRATCLIDTLGAEQRARLTTKAGPLRTILANGE